MTAATPDLLDLDWILVEKKYIPAMTSKPAAPKAELVKCRCKKRCVSRYQPSARVDLII
jgi:hypothetical protein